MLHIVTYLWGTKYGPEDLRKLINGVDRNLTLPHKWWLCTEDLYRPWIKAGAGTFSIDGLEHVTIVPIIRDLPLLDVKGCFARLRLFDPEWQEHRGFGDGDQILSIDLDVVVTGSLDVVVGRGCGEDFVVLSGANSSNPCPFNGSIWMLRVGTNHNVWTDFSLEAASKVPFYEFPDDQGWFWHKLPNAATWKVGPDSGIYAFQKPGWPKGDDLPADAKLVVFPGWRDPHRFQHLNWVRKYWR